MLSNCGPGEDTCESLGKQGNQISQSSRISTLGTLWKDCCWRWSSNTLATWCEEEKTLMLGKIEGKRRGGWQRMRWLDGISSTLNTNLSKLQKMIRNEKPGMLQSLGLQRVRHDWVTELNWKLVVLGCKFMVKKCLFRRRRRKTHIHQGNEGSF